MAVPAPATPSGNAYTINVARPAGVASVLPAFTAAAALLLRRWKAPVRMHASGDNPHVNNLRSFLNEAGAKPSAFSPAPSPDVPGEGFWKTTMTVVEALPGNNFWAEARQAKKVEWDPLLIALADRRTPADLPAGLAGIPDLWCVFADSGVVPESPNAVTARWIEAGAKAVCVLTASNIAWNSTGAIFGRSAGTRESQTEATQPAAGILGIFAAGIVAGMIRELLGENLFDKTLIRADRECLEMRPLRLGRAVLHAAAAWEAAATAENPGTLLRRGGGLAEATETNLARLRGPESNPWAHKGR
jgi:hypothetical protein